MADYLNLKLESLVNRRKDALQSACQDLGEKLLKVAKEISEKGLEASINSLGEIQLRGPEIDRLCGQFGDLQDLYNILKAEQQIAAENKEQENNNEQTV